LRQVSSDLTVVAPHRGKPIAGIKIQIVPEKSNEPVFSSTTDVNRTVLVEGLMVGRYHLTASHEDVNAGKEWIEVVAVPDAKTKPALAPCLPTSAASPQGSQTLVVSERFPSINRSIGPTTEMFPRIFR
jgi:hypothetical protein